MSAILCPACQHHSRLMFRTKDYDYRISNEIFDYHRCENCHLIFLDPIPANLDDYYTTAYYDVPSDVAALRAAAEQVKYTIELVHEFVTSGRVLDIGSGYGKFAFLAKEKGYTVETIEMDPASCDFLNRVVGIQVYQSDHPIPTLQQLGKYDVITLWHVIEHVTDPKIMVETVAEHLNPGGIAVFATPNPDSLQFKLLGSRWRHIQAPRHLTLISIPLISKWAEDSGLKTVLTTCLDEGSIGLNWLGWYRSFMNFSTVPSVRWVLGVIGRIIHKLLIPVERSDSRGCAYTVVFQKPL